MPPEVGDRVTVDVHKGFVRYVGEVEGQKGTWFGIEWDDPSRGKHNGTVNGKQYFVTSSPAGGSLVRSANITSGEDLLSQIKFRYDDDRNENNEEMGGRIVEKIGMQKILGRQRDIFRLSVIVLDHMTVCGPPPAGTPSFTRCTELNLHGNLLHRWKDVFEILKYFPRLQELILRHNFMENISSEDLPSEPVSAPVYHLVLNNCNISEKTVRLILSKFPAVTDLYVSGNRLSSFDPGPSGAQLRLIDLEHNPIRRFEDIAALSRIKGLQSLSLMFCEIERVRFGCSSCFPSLETLNLKGNKITEWDSVNELRVLLSLRTLYIDSRSLPAELALDVREILIAKLPSIQMLNRAAVSIVERRSAEMRFVNRYCTLSIEARKVHEEDLKRLIDVHGAPVVDTAKKGMLTVKVNIEFEGKIVNRPLPLTTTVSRLCEMVSRLFSLDACDIDLLLDRKGHQNPLDLPTRQLSFYSIEPGDCIRVTTKE